LISDYDNIASAFYKAAMGKKHNKYVIDFLDDYDNDIRIKLTTTMVSGWFSPQLSKIVEHDNECLARTISCPHIIYGANITIAC